MQTADLSPEHESFYFVCLEDWSDEMKDAGDHKERWYRRMKDRGLRVKLALDEDGKVGGMVEYLPIEHSSAEGSDLNFISCIWIHGYKQGRGDFRKKGMGKALLAAGKKTAALRASQEFGDKVVSRTVDTLDKDEVRKCGEASALIVDGMKVRTGPPRPTRRYAT